VVRILPLIGVIGLMLYTFFDVLATDRRRFTSLSKGLWLLVALIPVVGGLLWLMVGRPRRSGASGSVISLHRRPRPVAPDDDPEFLRRLDEQAWRAKRDSARSAESPPPENPSPPSPKPSSAAEDDSDTDARPTESPTDAAEEEGPAPPSGER
jgi:hypothetical protein